MAEPWAVEHLNFSTMIDWYAVQVQPRHEKSATTALKEKQIPTFLPLVNEFHNWSDRKQKVEMPLFPGYTFVALSGSIEERIAVLRSLGVVRLLGESHTGTPVSAQEMQNVWTLVNSRLTIERYPFVQVGDRVRIRSGSLKDVEGIIVGRDSDATLVISVTLLNRSLAVSIKGFEIERLRATPQSQAA